jgi:hypothetical protein
MRRPSWRGRLVTATKSHGGALCARWWWRLRTRAGPRLQGAWVLAALGTVALLLAAVAHTQAHGRARSLLQRLVGD